MCIGGVPYGGYLTGDTLRGGYLTGGGEERFKRVGESAFLVVRNPP